MTTPKTMTCDCKDTVKECTNKPDCEVMERINERTMPVNFPIHVPDMSDRLEAVSRFCEEQLADAKRRCDTANHDNSHIYSAVASGEAAAFATVIEFIKIMTNTEASRT